MDNPDARVDLLSYSQRARATAEAIAISVRARYDDFAAPVTAPIRSFSPQYAAGLLADWNLIGEYWSNLLRTEPACYAEVEDSIAKSRGL